MAIHSAGSSFFLGFFLQKGGMAFRYYLFGGPTKISV